MRKNRGAPQSPATREAAIRNWKIFRLRSAYQLGFELGNEIICAEVELELAKLGAENEASRRDRQNQLDFD